jgi:GNAT superfamily N-acetyltransferase
MTFTLHKGYLSGAIGRVAELHGTYYRKNSGFGVNFEAGVARGLSDFCERYDEARDGLWLALAEGRVEAAIAIDGSKAKTDGAHLRWFIASDALRGSGVGTALLTAAVDFCRAQNYRLVYLWTFEGLAAARHLYEKTGFQLTLQQPGTRWGSPVNEQRFELQL